MHRRTGAARLASLALIGAVATGCGASSITIIDEGPEEHMPLWAGFDLRGEPPVATRDLRLHLDVLPDAPGLRAIDITPGTTIRWTEGLSEGPIRLVSVTPDCTWEVTLPPERTTPIVFHHEAEPCWFEIGDPIEAGDAGHLSATVAVQPWEGLLVEAISLDDPRRPVPAPVPPDEGGLAQLDPLWPGRYDVVLRRGDHILERKAIEIPASSPQGTTITLTLDGVPD